MDDITALNELYKIVAMGIIGIDEVKGHIEDKALAKTMVDAKKKYMVNKMDITNMLNELGEKPTEINIIIKTFNEIYTGIELIKCDDAKIAKMLTEGTNKGIIKVEEILKRFPKIKSGEINSENHPDICAKFDVFSVPVFLLYVNQKESLRIGRNVDLLALEGKMQRYYEMIYED